ncbi:head GIN domain-containing protein [Tenacibaculum sp. 190524A02b]|uniref:Auto-transporter adhesin, head GIN domain n=1 Tax=Tenacibaculum vairaonense TaxID=3137860 RepID=A0ABM9PQ31_9FLAO
MKNLVFFSLFFIALSTFSQEEITKKLGGFTTLKVYNGIDVELIKSNENKAIVKGEKSGKVKFKSVNDTLKIVLAFPETTADGKAKITLYYTEDIAIIDANEGAIITSKKISQQKVEIKAQEGAFINMVVAIKHLKVKSTSGSVIKLSGKAKNQTVNVDLGANYHGYNLTVENLNTVRAGSGAKAEVQSGEILDAKVSFGGSIFYKGKPEVLKDKKVIGGVIEHRS